MMLQHDKASPSPFRFDHLKSFNQKFMANTLVSNQHSESNKIVKSDGLNDIQYDVLEITKKPLYTHIIVDF